MRFLVPSACALVLVGTLVLAGSPGSSGARSRAPLPAFVGCAGVPDIRPDYILLGCGDGGQFLASVRWSSWSPDKAVGRGVWWQNLCTPDCAAGHFRRDRVSVALYRPRLCAHRARRWFTRMTLHYLDRGRSGATTGSIHVKAPFVFDGDPGCP